MLKRNPSYCISDQLPISAIPSIFSDFEKAIGSRYWIDCVKDNFASIKQNPLLRESRMRDFDFAHCLYYFSSQVEKHGFLPLPDARDFSQVKTVQTMWNFLEVLKLAKGQKEASALIARMRSTFRRSDALRGYQFELSAAAGLIRNEVKVSFPEIENCGRSDMLLELGGIQAEADCKSIGIDSGDSHTSGSAMLLFEKIRKLINPDVVDIKDDSTLCVKIVFSSDIQSAHLYQHEVITAVSRAISTRQTQVTNYCKVDTDWKHVYKFFSDSINNIKKIPDFDFPSIEDVLMIHYFQASLNDRYFTIDNGRGRAVVVLIKTDVGAVWKKRIERIRESVSKVKRQTSGNKPAIAFVRLEDLSWEEFERVFRPLPSQPTYVPATEYGANLLVAASRLLEQPNSRHLCAISFWSKAGRGKSSDEKVINFGSQCIHLINASAPLFNAGLEAILRGQRVTRIPQ